LPETKLNQEKWGSAAEKAIGEILSLEPMHIDEIIKKSGLSSSSALSGLTLLQVKGLVKNQGGMRYSLLT
jgi:DNA processing protein